MYEATNMIDKIKTQVNLSIQAYQQRGLLCCTVYSMVMVDVLVFRLLKYVDILFLKY